MSGHPMKIPSRLKVGAYHYKVSMAPLTDEGRVGQTYPSRQEIQIAPGQAPHYERDTVIHELLHAIMQQTSLSKMTLWDEGVEEAIVLAVSPLLLQTLRENPRLTNYLLEKVG